MLPVLLALACALCYGGSDYTSGLAVRQAGLLQVTVTAEVTRAILVIAVVPLASSQNPSPASLAWGAAAGISGVAGIMALNLGFRHTAFSVVSPIGAVVAAAVPVLVGLHLGERLSPLSLAGIVLALPAILAVSARRGEAATSPAERGDMAVSPALVADRGWRWPLTALSSGPPGRPVPDSAELFAAARKPSLDPEPEIAIVWPSAIVLPGWADGTLGEVKLRPSAVTGPWSQ